MGAAFFILLFLAITAFWAGLGWVLGRYAGSAGVLVFVIFDLATVANPLSHPQILREGIGLLSLLVSMAVGALVCLDARRKHTRLRRGPLRSTKRLAVVK